MRKNMLLFIVLVFFLCGCTRIDYETNNYSDLVVNCLSKNAYTNDVALGYRYYLPKGVRLKKNYDYNQVFLVDDVNIYMYVDINGYYHNVKKIYDDDDVKSFYYEKINYNGKIGYIKINKIDNDNYYTKILYNYSSMEFYSSYSKLNKMVTYSAIILNSVRYNRNVIEKVLSDNFGEFSDVTYTIQKPENASSDFSRYLEEYVQNDDDAVKLPDD